MDTFSPNLVTLLATDLTISILLAYVGKTGMA
jgi:hypothetical protein